MYLPRKLMKYYTYNENEIFFQKYPANQVDDMIINLFYKNATFSYVNVETFLSFPNSFRIKHKLEIDDIKRNISEDEYMKYVKICFFKLGYHILNIVEKIDRNSNLLYEFELCPLIKRKNIEAKVLKKI